MKLLSEAKKIVIKVGSSFIVDPKTGIPKLTWINNFVEDVVSLINQGKKVIIVSSGSVALGCNMLGLNLLKAKLQDKQNASVCGQHEMISLYKNSFATHDINVAQALLTIEDVENRKRFTSIKAGIDSLLEFNIIPIINENDLLANTEIRYGDNDRLSARVAHVMGADLLIMFALVDGLYIEDPEEAANPEFVTEIYEITPDIEKMAGDSAGKTGGMSAKIVAAKMAMKSNCNVIIANGNHFHPIKQIMGGARCSSFIIEEDAIQKYKIG